MKTLKHLFKHIYTWLILAWSLLVLINVLQTLIYKLTVAPKYSWMWVFKFPIITYIIGILLIFLWIVPGYKFISKFDNYLRVSLFIIHGMGYMALYVLAIFFVFGIWANYLNIEWYYNTVSKFFITDLHNVLKSYIFLTAIIFAFNYFKDKKETIVLKNNIEKELIITKHNALKAKLQPHFLFNALNSIVALIDENKIKAQNSLISLSDLLRYSMNIKPEKMIPINEELVLLKKYITIEKARYENQLQVKWVINNLESSFNLPAMILQPIVENSIKHGFKNIHKTLILVIEVNSKEKVVVIKNNGNKLSNKTTEGNGLQLVKQRLSTHFYKASTFKIFQEENWVINELIFKKLNE
ncbi:sensor histidine kinase [Ichthyenterobacterium magnum]|uniref:Histidine kinase n=1 Tax=Ichthyenterobacterium magnum TaxID=1230530 RepID=A0A420DFI8_9FLAO|nr:histidine kinase [Ichthyenterobacterium magnum]RKE90799.1 histidine kinase [Ichthyenterobacterium magnum]